MASARDPERSLVESRTLALALIALLGATYAIIARFVLDRFPFSGDEYSMALQGELFARGMLKSISPAHIEWLRVDHVVIDQFIRSKYPPGAPALLSIGARFGVAWLVTPLEAVAALTVVWHTVRRVLGAREGLVALLTLGLAPLFAFNAASFFAHTPAIMFFAIAFAAVATWCSTKHQGALVLAGAAIGCTFLIRPFDALLIGVAMIALRSWRAVIIPAISALPFVALDLVYQAAQFGSPLTDGYQAYQPTLIALYGPDTAASPISLGNLVNPVQQWFHLDVYRALLVDWTIPGAAIIALFGAFAIGRAHPARSLRAYSLAVIGVYVGALLLMRSDPDDGARPRYLSNVLIPIAFLAAAGYEPICTAVTKAFGGRIRKLFVAGAIVLALGQLGAFLQRHVPEVWRREGLYHVVEAAQLHDAVVIVRAQYPSRFARNGAFFDGPVLYLSAPPETPAATIAAAYPGRAIWEAHEGVPWTLSLVRR